MCEQGFIKGTPANCIVCGKPIKKIAEIHRFCSTECRDKYYSEDFKPTFIPQPTRMEIACADCGKSIEIKIGSSIKYCSECFKKRRRSVYKYKPKEYRTKICMYCGKEFTTKRETAKFCSQKCGYKFRYILKRKNVIEK